LPLEKSTWQVYGNPDLAAGDPARSFLNSDLLPKLRIERNGGAADFPGSLPVPEFQGNMAF
jgi:hypothetical protein